MYLYPRAIQQLCVYMCGFVKEMVCVCVGVNEEMYGYLFAYLLHPKCCGMVGMRLSHSKR